MKDDRAYLLHIQDAAACMELVWRTVEIEIPRLKQAVEELLRAM